MKQFPENISFKFSWRKYQERVLDELGEHLNDRHLHIIAPPGSGKTILGLEVALRINKPTLIFAPTIAIRDQWVDRFKELFLQEDIIPDWISKDINKPSFLTVSTYQGLYAAMSGKHSDDVAEIMTGISSRSSELIKQLKKRKIGTIVLDEAHHLKNAWWNALHEIKSELEPSIVGLTATPPYDVSYYEWQRYSELNGPVDAEISVPELVVEGDLCPHQDYIYFSLPSENEQNALSKHKERIQDLFKELIRDTQVCNIIQLHPSISAPEANLEAIYNNLEFYSASLIYLNAAGKEIPPINIEVTGNKKSQLPNIDYHWMEILLEKILTGKDPYFAKQEEFCDYIKNKLKRAGAVEHNRVAFTRNSKLDGFLSSSISKLNSIQNVVDNEFRSLGNELRLVVLTDFIRKEFLSNETKNNIALSKIGVVPIFEQLRRNNTNKKKLGVLSGSLIIVPTKSINTIQNLHHEQNKGDISFTTLPYDLEYSILNLNEKSKKTAVQIITKIFQDGEIEVLIGTKSLLGEGWDAPAINALVLASFVGSYVLSNQMRGRAIRTDQNNLTKTGNIWHLVCIDPSSDDGGNDMNLLRRRFKAFVGTSLNSELYIKNGIDRLQVPTHISYQKEADIHNKRMASHAIQRDKLRSKWEETLKNGTTLIEEIKAPYPEEKNYKKTKAIYTNKTLGYMFGIILSGFTAFLEPFLDIFSRGIRNMESSKDIFTFISIAAGVLLIVSFGFFIKYFRLAMKYRDISKDIQNIGNALLHSLVHKELIKTDVRYLQVVSSTDETGAVYCNLEGGTNYERSLFIKSLAEIIGTVDDPRYVIIRKSLLLDIMTQKDYHSVPELLGRKGKDAQRFKNYWEHNVGSCELIYTRNIEGRKLLMKSRFKSLAAQLEDKTERVNRWK